MENSVLACKLYDIRETADSYITESEKVRDVLRNLVIKTSLVNDFNNEILRKAGTDITFTIERTKLIKDTVEKLTNIVNDLEGDTQ